MRDYQLPGRSAIYASNGMAATAHPSASLVAIDVLRSGGNAVDAAIAAAAVLGVIEPGMSGIGGDCFALVYRPGKGVAAYNGSGKASRSISADRLQELGIDQISADSPHSVTIPGAVEAWQSLLNEHGTRGLEDLLEPAIRFADEGHIVQPKIAMEWQLGVDRLKCNPAGSRMYLNQGEPYHAGDHHRQPELANALREIAKHGAQGFYSGPVAEDIVNSLKNVGGLQTLDDFARVGGEWTAPIASEYRGHRLFECPPNGQGFIVSNMLNILSNFAIDELELNSAVNLHLQIEASRLAYADRDRFFDEYYASDQAEKALERLLSQEYGRSQSELIDEAQTMPMAAAMNAARGGDTTYVAVADRDGNMISLMNSLYYPFGSGLVSETYGILLHNRGCAFEVTGSTQRKIESGKRPPHTILPAMLLKDDQPVMTFGVVGAEHQPTGQVRMISAVVDAGMDVQQALDAPRVFLYDGVVQVEHGFPDSFTDELAAFGHKIQISGSPIGAGQAIWIDREQGRFVGGSDFRKDGCAMGF